jgi:hypothetical protein
MHWGMLPIVALAAFGAGEAVERFMWIRALEPIVYNGLVVEILPEGAWYYTDGGWRCPAGHMCPLTDVEPLVGPK